MWHRHGFQQRKSCSLFPLRVVIKGTDLSCSQRDLEWTLEITVHLCKTFQTAWGSREQELC